MVKKRYGITINPPRREGELKREYAGFRKFKVEKKFPNKKEAQKWEDKQSGTHNPGGPKTKGTHYGYSHEYKNKKKK